MNIKGPTFWNGGSILVNVLISKHIADSMNDPLLSQAVVGETKQPLREYHGSASSSLAVHTSSPSLQCTGLPLYKYELLLMVLSFIDNCLAF
jgi:hypothetical protein